MICVSNLAWSHDEFAPRQNLLKDIGVGGLEIAPTLIWPTWEWDGWTPELPVVSLQSVFYGMDCQLLGDEHALFAHWKRVCMLAAALKVKSVVYGSPRLRIGSDLDLALERLDRMSEMLPAELCVEVLPRPYGCEILDDFEQAFELADKWKVNLDTGAFMVSGADVRLIARYLNKIGHVHVSQPMLGMFDAPDPMHKTIAAMLTEYTGNVSLEMPRCNEPQLLRGIKFMMKHY